MLEPNSLVNDAIHAAGGPTANADLDRVNLAAPLENHQQVMIPHRLVESIQRGFELNVATKADLVNINSADSEELQSLPGIGPVLAERILVNRDQYGPFAEIDGLIAINGIGEKTLDNLRALITVNP
jgi:competence protein ComEA